MSYFGYFVNTGGLSATDPRVRRIVIDLIVNRGLSYIDAIAECERQAQEVAAPYVTAAALVRAELERIQSSERSADTPSTPALGETQR